MTPATLYNVELRGGVTHWQVDRSHGTTGYPHKCAANRQQGWPPILGSRRLNDTAHHRRWSWWRRHNARRHQGGERHVRSWYREGGLPIGLLFKVVLSTLDWPTMVWGYSILSFPMLRLYFEGRAFCHSRRIQDTGPTMVGPTTWAEEMTNALPSKYKYFENYFEKHMIVIEKNLKKHVLWG